MTTKAFDPDAYKAAQRRDWDQAAAGWRAWWQHLEGMLGPAGHRLVELTGVSTGQRVLDVATGIGEPAISAAKMVGPEGRVVGIDIAPEMLEIAAERARALGLDNVEFRVMDAEALDFPESSFEVALCRFGLMFLPDVSAALQGMRRVLAAGGRFGATVWGPPERVPMTRATLGAVARVLELPPPAPGTAGVFALADPQRLEQLVRGAGFTDVATEWLPLPATFESLEEYLRFVQDVGAPIKNLLAERDAETRQRVWEAVAEAARQFVGADGRLEVSGDSLLVTGHC